MVPALYVANRTRVRPCWLRTAEQRSCGTLLIQTDKQAPVNQADIVVMEKQQKNSDDGSGSPMWLSNINKRRYRYSELNQSLQEAVVNKCSQRWWLETPLTAVENKTFLNTTLLTILKVRLSINFFKVYIHAFIHHL